MSLRTLGNKHLLTVLNRQVVGPGESMLMSHPAVMLTECFENYYKKEYPESILNDRLITFQHPLIQSAKLFIVNTDHYWSGNKFNWLISKNRDFLEQGDRKYL